MIPVPNVRQSPFVGLPGLKSRRVENDRFIQHEELFPIDSHILNSDLRPRAPIPTVFGELLHFFDLKCDIHILVKANLHEDGTIRMESSVTPYNVFRIASNLGGGIMPRLATVANGNKSYLDIADTSPSGHRRW